MTTLQSIESHDKNLQSLLTDFYVVPSYQREYVWEEEQVEQLLGDIHAEFADQRGGEASEYFIGSIVVCDRADDQRLDLIDGQQRMTTTYLLLCAIRDHLKAISATVPQNLDGFISAADTDAQGNDVHHYRVELQYEDSGGVLQRIAARSVSVDGLAELSGTRSIENIRNAYLAARAFVKEKFGEDDAALKRFYAYLTKNVKLIRIQTRSVAHALRIFETINDRGKGLDAMDLLKNLMFMQVRPEQFEPLKKRWKALVDTIHTDAQEKPLRFLRYFVFATYDVERLKEEEIYAWFRDHRAEVGYERQPLEFVDRLVEAATAYARFANGKDARGTPNRYLANIARLSGAARQHVLLLLAGRHLSPDDFSELCRQLENLLFTYVITRENTREFERKFSQWATSLRGVTDRASLDTFVASHFVPAKAALSARFDLTFRDLDLATLQQYRRRYLLAKLTQFVDEQGFGRGGSVAELDGYLDKRVDIEHVLPQTLTDDVLREFGGTAEEARWLVNRLGDLALVEKPLNTSLGNKPFSQKRPVYPSSRYLLTRTISDAAEIGVNTSVDRAVRAFTPFAAWTKESIAARQAMLSGLARRVWEIPDPSQASP